MINPIVTAAGPFLSVSKRDIATLADVANSTAARVDEVITTRAPGGAISEQLASDRAYAEGVRDMLTWLLGEGADDAPDRLRRLLD